MRRAGRVVAQVRVGNIVGQAEEILVLLLVHRGIEALGVPFHAVGPEMVVARHGAAGLVLVRTVHHATGETGEGRRLVHILVVPPLPEPRPPTPPDPSRY